MRNKKRAKLAKPATNATPQWFAFAIVALLTVMICIAINIRAFSEMSEQKSQHSTLSEEIERLKTENTELKKKVQNLKNDKKTIGREARKIGMSRQK